MTKYVHTTISDEDLDNYKRRINKAGQSTLGKKDDSEEANIEGLRENIKKSIPDIKAHLKESLEDLPDDLAITIDDSFSSTLGNRKKNNSNKPEQLTSKDLVGQELDALEQDLETIRGLGDIDFEVDEKSKHCTLTPEGISKAEDYFHLDNLYDIKNSVIVHNLDKALVANYGFKRDVDYVVENDKVLIVDAFTGRLMHGRQFSEGLHQAIEAKEGVKINEETKTMATITFQNLFRMYDKLSGMTGTAMTEEEEFKEIYKLVIDF